ncbi:hypothetical protein HK099_004463 [Clydaea vesicula]|uniref:Uncharacterized protein n=1 Tax=Clydaea vesicula TaxID=447962 RepID=A0AAD5Y091_9FUNG|nr:hypothetical protein HK099_004463 [Clydaea vesicula]
MSILVLSAEIRLIFLILPTILLAAFNLEFKDPQNYLGDPMIISNLVVSLLSAFYFENSPLIFAIDLLMIQRKLDNTKASGRPTTTKSRHSDNSSGEISNLASQNEKKLGPTLIEIPA